MQWRLLFVLGALQGDEAQLYELEASGKGQALHLNADPTTAELMNKIYREKKDALKANKVNSVLDKYGGQEHMEQLHIQE